MIERPNLRLLEFILQESLSSEWVFSQCLVKAAGGGNLDVADRLLIAKADVNAEAVNLSR